MRSNYGVMSKSEVMRRIRQELNKEYPHMEEDIARTQQPQLMAVVLYVLHKSFGFGKKRIQQFMDSYNGYESMMMSDDAFLGRKVNPQDIRKYVEDKFGVDLEITVLKLEKEKSK